jgi:hypothetical protein
MLHGVEHNSIQLPLPAGFALRCLRALLCAACELCFALLNARLQVLLYPAKCAPASFALPSSLKSFLALLQKNTSCYLLLALLV